MHDGCHVIGSVTCVVVNGSQFPVLWQESLAKGLVPAARMGLLAETERKEIFKDVTINDAPSQIRYYLTRRGTQEMVQRASNTVIVTKGRFCGAGSAADSLEKPLFLRVTPGHSAGEVRRELSWTVVVQASCGMYSPSQEGYKNSTCILLLCE